VLATYPDALITNPATSSPATQTPANTPAFGDCAPAVSGFWFAEAL
jgi:hypothetical protein